MIPVCWEQRVFALMSMPLDVALIGILVILRPIYWVFIITKVPMLLLLMIMSLIWMPCALFISLFAMFSRRFLWIRPLSFVLILPFLIAAYVVVSLSPVPDVTLINDVAGKVVKLDFVQSFPYGHL